MKSRWEMVVTWPDGGTGEKGKDGRCIWDCSCPTTAYNPDSQDIECDVLKMDGACRHRLIHVKCPCLLVHRWKIVRGPFSLMEKAMDWSVAHLLYPNISTVMFKFRTFSSSSALLMYLATRDLVKICTVDLSQLRIWFASFFVGFQCS